MNLVGAACLDDIVVAVFVVRNQSTELFYLQCSLISDGMLVYLFVNPNELVERD